MIISLVFNILISGLLAGCIYYSYKLNRKLTTLQSTKAEMEALIAELNQATGRAEGGVFALKASAKDLAHNLTEKIGESKAVLDDLNFILSRADSLANSLTDQVTQGRKSSAPDSATTKQVSNDDPGLYVADDGSSADEFSNKLRALK